MINNIDVIKGLEIVGVSKESMLNSHTPGEYVMAGATIVLVILALTLAFVTCIKEHKKYKREIELFGAIVIGIMLCITLLAGIVSVDVGVRDIKAQSRGEESATSATLKNSIILGKEYSRKVLEVKVDEMHGDEEWCRENVGEFMREFEEKYEVVEVGDNGVWKVVVRE